MPGGFPSSGKGHYCSRGLPPRSGGYSHYFLVQKKTGDLRSVLDLRGLNIFLKRILFRMLRLTEMQQAIAPGNWVVSIYLSKAYFPTTLRVPTGGSCALSSRGATTSAVFFPSACPCHLVYFLAWSRRPCPPCSLRG